MRLGFSRHEHLSVLSAQGSLETKHIPSFFEGLLRFLAEKSLTLMVDLSQARISPEAAQLIAKNKDQQRIQGHKYILISHQVPESDFGSLMESLHHLNIPHPEIVHEILRLKLELQNFERGIKETETALQKIFQEHFEETLPSPIPKSILEKKIEMLLEKREREFPILQKIKSEIQTLFPYYQSLDRNPRPELEDLRNHLLKELESLG